MKKKIVILATLLTFVSTITGCGDVDVAEEIKDSYEEQTTWTKEHDALTNGRSSTEVLEETIEDLTGVQVDLSGTDDETGSQNGKHSIGETVSLTGVYNDGSKVAFDVTVTGYESVYDEIDHRNNIAVYYTVKNTGDNDLYFSNSDWNFYVDNYSVEKTSSLSLDVTEFSGAELSTGRLYDGIVVGMVNPDEAGTIEIECGDAVWCLQQNGESVSAQSEMSSVETEYPIFNFGGAEVDYSEFAGEFGGEGITLSMSMYSSLDGDGSIGSFTLSDEMGFSWSGTLYYIGDNQIQAMADNDLDIFIFTVGEGYTVTIGAPDYPYMDCLTLQMQQRYES